MNGIETLNNGNGRTIVMAGNGITNHVGFAGVGPDCVFNQVTHEYIPRADVNGNGQEKPVEIKINQRTTI